MELGSLAGTHAELHGSESVGRLPVCDDASVLGSTFAAISAGGLADGADVGDELGVDDGDEDGDVGGGDDDDSQVL